MGFEETTPKHLAKNTFYLYARMIIMLLVGLYTSRVVLYTLGVVDYGIYNVVGSAVSIFVFVNNAMVSSTQRFITYELGKKDQTRLSLVFSTSINIHAVICLFFLLMSETLGLWFFYNKMIIPEERMTTAFWVYQFSVLSCFVGIISVPYNALIIAYEKMSAFAYISLLDAFLKLLIVFVVQYSKFDKLFLYAFLLLFISLFDRFIYKYYCDKRFPDIRYRFLFDVELMKKMAKFASWSLIGNLAYVCYTQGLNLLLNVFFNPIVNAARGVAVQVQAVVNNFCINIENAIRPQITKQFAYGNYQKMYSLLFLSARLSFFVLLIISFPVFFEAETILDIWLVSVPDHTMNFVRLVLLVTIVDSFASPLLTAAQATGDIKKYQTSVGVLSLLILPFSYLFLKIWHIPEIVFVVSLAMSVVIQMVKILIVCRQINLAIKDYINKVVAREILVILVAILLFTPIWLFMKAGLVRMFLSIVFSSIIIVATVYYVGLTSKERCFINAIVLSKCKFIKYIRN